MKAVLVEWSDSCAAGGKWENKLEITVMRPANCKTLGFVCYEDEECIVLLQTESGDIALNETAIPKGCIKKIKILKV